AGGRGPVLENEQHAAIAAVRKPRFKREPRDDWQRSLACDSMQIALRPQRPNCAASVAVEAGHILTMPTIGAPIARPIFIAWRAAIVSCADGRLSNRTPSSATTEANEYNRSRPVAR